MDWNAVMEWNVVVPGIVSVVMFILSFVLYRRALKRAVTPEQKLNLNRIIFVTMIFSVCVGVWWVLRH